LSSLSKESIMKDLRQMPGIGKKMALDLYELGFRSISDLKGRNPEEMYQEHCQQKGVAVDRCVLYVFRCAVYFASEEKHDPQLLKWWNWKDRQF